MERTPPVYWGVGGNYAPTATLQVYDNTPAPALGLMNCTGTCGGGLHATLSGTYTNFQQDTYCIIIQTGGATNPNTYKWSTNNCSGFVQTGVSVSCSATALNNGVSVTWSGGSCPTTPTGGTVNDQYTFTANPGGTTAEIIQAGVGQNGSPFIVQDNNNHNSLQVASNGVATLGTAGVYPGQLLMAGSTSGNVTLQPAAVAGGTITFPNVTGNAVTTGDSGTVSNAMLANSAVTIGGSAVSLGGSLGTTAAPQFASLGLGTAAAAAASPLTVVPAARTSGSPYLAQFTAPSDTGLALSEFNDYIFDSGNGIMRTYTGASGGTITSQRFSIFYPPTLATVSGLETITNGITLAIGGPPLPGTGVTITNPVALWVQATTGAPSSSVPTNGYATLMVEPSSGSNGLSADFLGGITVNGKFQVVPANGVVKSASNGVFGFVSGSSTIGNSPIVGISSGGATAVLDVGNGSSGDTTGTMVLTATQSVGLTKTNLPTCNTAALGTITYCTNCKNFHTDGAAFDSAAVAGGHGTNVLCEDSGTPEWTVH